MTVNKIYENFLSKKEYSSLLELTIVTGDIDGLKSMLSNNEVVKALSKSSDYFLEQAYIVKNYKIAEFLLSYGIEFNIKHFLHLDKNNDKSTEHFKYLHSIKEYLSLEQFDNAYNLLIAFHSPSINLVAAQNCYRIEDILMSITYLSSYKETDKVKEMYYNLYTNYSVVITDILTVIALTNLNHPLLKLYMPTGNSAYLEAAQASNNQIYFPVNNFDRKEQSFLIHELGHQALQVLFSNNKNPFPANSTDILHKYHAATKQCLVEIFSLFNLTVNDKDNIIQNETTTVRDVLSSLAYNAPLHIFSFNTVPNSKAHNDRLAQTYLGQHGMSDEHKAEFLEHFLNNFATNLHFDQNIIYFLSRISEFSLRNDKELDKEFIVRLGEFEVYGIKENLAPIMHEAYEYWEEFIHSEVEKLKAGIDMPECTIADSTIEVDLAGDIVP